MSIVATVITPVLCVKFKFACAVYFYHVAQKNNIIPNFHLLDNWIMHNVEFI